MSLSIPLHLPDPQWHALQDAYTQPARAYHNWTHVQDVLAHWQAVADGPGWSHPDEVLLAMLYHDAIYDAGRADNEQRSAEFARQQILRWMPERAIDVDRVVELIELTARHGQLTAEQLGSGKQADDTRLFLDCDMAILGAGPAAFDAYDRAIAAEYRPVVPGWLYSLKRRKFLKSLLARERIYLSDFFHARLDARARSNLRRAVTSKR